MSALMLVHLVNGANVGMIQSGSAACFPLETLQRPMVLRKLFGKELDRHGTAELEVLGLIDHTHTPAAQLLQDAVMRDGLAGHARGLPAVYSRLWYTADQPSERFGLFRPRVKVHSGETFLFLPL